MTSPLRILLLEDDPTNAALIQELVEANNIASELTRAQTRAEYLSELEDPAISLILADYRLPSFDGLSALKLAQSIRPGLPFIFVSGTLGKEVAIEAPKIDATDYVLKSRLSRLAPSVKRALREASDPSAAGSSSPMGAGCGRMQMNREALYFGSPCPAWKVSS